MSFLKDAWYFAGWSDELAESGKLARTIVSEPILFWRTDGALHAVADRCAHRLAPLHMGRIDGTVVECSYHGLTFSGETGRCVRNPHGPITNAMTVRAYPSMERHRGIWVWTGMADAADPNRIPDLGFIDAAGPHAISKGYMYTAASHKLLEDNILDLSHTDYLHPTTLGGGAISRTKAKIEERDGKIWVRWLSPNEPPAPFLQPDFCKPGILVDMWTEVTWHPNGVMPLIAGAAEAGCGREAGLNTLNVHIMKPETETTTRYFYANARDYRVDDADCNDAMAAALKHVFGGDDKPFIEAQQRALGNTDLFDHRPALMTIDNGSTRARRMYDRLVAKEFAALQSA